MNIKKDHGKFHNGGFGIIHKMELEDGSFVAKKVFSPDRKDSLSEELMDKLRKRFSREVRIQENLSSDFCIPILESCLTVEQPYFIMPYAEKVYSDEISVSRLARRKPEGLGDILNAMEYLHDLGYVHRDLKPGNILFHEGKWKLADMGLITADPEFSSEFFTSKDFAAGSQAYMAPEQFTSFSKVTHHADIYSFGCILHDIFVGTNRVPHRKQTSSGNIGIIIEKCTEEDITRRFQKVDILRNTLLGELSKDAISNNVNEDTEVWVEKLTTALDWDFSDLESFQMFLDRNEETKQILLYQIDGKILREWLKLDIYLWKDFVLNYFKWIESKQFDFDYCDVIIGHIKICFQLTSDVEIKCTAVITAAELGASHNRWYVMKQVFQMLDNLDDNLENRIGIEILVAGYSVKNNFKNCALQLKKKVEDYPEKIRNVLLFNNLNN